MNISISSVLFGLGGECLLNWALVFLQRNHIWRSFVGVFSLSLAVVDTALTLAVTTIYIHADGYFLFMGLQLTRYHVCLLVQILGHVYRVLHWPVVVVAGLDHFCVVSRRLQSVTIRTTWILYLVVTSLLWYLGILYVFLLSDISPVLEDVSHYQMHQCWIFHMSQIRDVAVLLVFFILGYIVWRAGHPVFSSLLQLSNNPHLKDQLTDQSRIPSRINFAHQVLHIFLNTWAFFLAFLVLLILLPVGIPAYLGLNVAWLCFFNSLLIGVTLCGVYPVFELAQGLAAVPPDSFCEWKFKFSFGTDDTT